MVIFNKFMFCGKGKNVIGRRSSQLYKRSTGVYIYHREAMPDKGKARPVQYTGETIV